MSSHEAHAEGHGDLGHIVPLRVYQGVFVALLVLTVITVLVAKFVDLGVMNIVIAMLIASVKAMLVALFFMHLKFESKITWLYAAFPLILLGIMMAGIFIDNPLRRIEEPVVVTDSLVKMAPDAQP